MSTRYLHTMVRVADLDAALDFYCGKLGLEEARRIDNEAGRFTLVFLAAPGDAQRAQNERAPLVERTTRPSGRPIMSSWRTGPLWVWNSPPGARVTR